MMTQAAGGLGAVSIVDEEGVVIGVFTDGDLRRHLLLPGFDLQGSISKVMTEQPSWVYGTQLVAEAAQIVKERNIDQILVVNENNHPIGWLDVHDLLVMGLLTPQS